MTVTPAADIPAPAIKGTAAADRDGLARGLGWVSLALGLSDVFGARLNIRLLGFDDSSALLAVFRLVGVREVTQAAGLLTSRQPTRWLWTRVVGDVMDLSVLGWQLRKRRRGERFRGGLATAGLTALTAVDLFAATRGGSGDAPSGGVELNRSITVNRQPSEIYSFWRNFENLPRIIPQLERVDVRDDRRSHWVVKAPVGHWTWDAEITREEPDRLIAWRATTGVPNTGEVRFVPAPGERGTEVRFTLAYRLPGGAAAATLARLAGQDPDLLVRDALRRLKQVLESGEAVAADERVSPRGGA